MAATTTVTITIVGVRKEHLTRLKTAVKGQLGRFGNNYTIDDGSEEEPKKEPPHKRKR